MLANVFTKTIRDRWLGATIAGGAIALWLLMAASIYRDIDLTIYTDMPEFMRNLMGIPQGADVGALAYSVVLGFAGAVTLASIALSMGSASIAGEEKDGTFGLLLGNPKTRTAVLGSKAGSMVFLVGMAALILWGAGIVVPKILDFSTGGMFLEAIIFHLFVNALVSGFMAIMIGGVMVPATSLAQERQDRTLTALTITPTTLGDVLTAKGILGVLVAATMAVVTLELLLSVQV